MRKVDGRDTRKKLRVKKRKGDGERERATSSSLCRRFDLSPLHDGHDYANLLQRRQTASYIEHSREN